MNTHPTVSICVPAYNAGQYLAQCLDSALSQTFKDFELVLADNASTDDTYAIAIEYARRDRRFQVHRNPQNIGAHANFNRCMDLARGEWLKFLCADDWLEPTCLEQMLSVRRPDTLLIACQERLTFEADVTETERKKHLAYWDVHTVLPRRFPGQSFVSAEEFADLVVDDPTFNCVGAPNSSMFHRNAFLKFGRKRADLATHDDWEMAMRVAVHTGIGYVAEPLANFRQHGTSLSSTGFARRRFEMEIIAPLIIRREVVHAPEYAPVRAAARRRIPPVDLVSTLYEAVLEADRMAHDFARKSLDAKALSNWSQFLRCSPQLANIPYSYYVFRQWNKVARRLQTKFPQARLSISA